jgi:hypothetical protein
MASTKKKAWQEKLANEKDLPKVIELSGKDAQRWGGKPPEFRTHRGLNSGEFSYCTFAREYL